MSDPRKPDPRRSPHRIERRSSTTLGARHSGPPSFQGERFTENAVLDCGWGRLIFAHTFRSNAELVAEITQAVPEQD